MLTSEMELSPPDAAGLGDSGHERTRGWGRWVRTNEGSQKVAVLDQMVTGVAGGDQIPRRRTWAFYTSSNQ